MIDLVRNLRYLDPYSVILLYDGGQAQQLRTSRFPLERYGAVLHPSPMPMVWGRLHDFALECMRFALKSHPFDVMTIVDSDQLGTRPGYSEYLTQFLHGRTRTGLLGNSPRAHQRNTPIAPVRAAFQEFDLWRPFLQNFQLGERKFVHWTFWPSTVFTADAARDLTHMFSTNRKLQDIMARTKIWASEEVILPTVTALLGYEITANPCSHDYVRYRTSYSQAQIDAALNRKDVFWIHPVSRHYADGSRKRIRERLSHYQMAPNGGAVMAHAPGNGNAELVLPLPILNKIKNIPGRLELEEADLLIAAACQALTSLPDNPTVVEIGRFSGRSTVVLASVVQSLRVAGPMYSIHPVAAQEQVLDHGIDLQQPTLDVLRRNLSGHGLSQTVQIVPQRSDEVVWQKPIALLLIDGFHDYADVFRDFHPFEQWVVPGGYIAFHESTNYDPGVRAFMNEVLTRPDYETVHRVKGMTLFRKNLEAESVPLPARDEAPGNQMQPLLAE
ncbi:MAG TPA: class I SAM-dependent methyltransferase [Candidatus Angelobacter sp.]